VPAPRCAATEKEASVGTERTAAQLDPARKVFYEDVNKRERSKEYFKID
jgi:hypothetical protein